MKKSSWVEKSPLKNLEKMQKLSGLTAAIGIPITISATYFLPLAKEHFYWILFIGFVASVFTAVYYLTPKIYLNERLVLLPDIIYPIILAFVMYHLRQFGYLYLIFFLLIIAIKAFTFDFKRFVFTIASVCLSLIIANLLLADKGIVPIYNILFEIYWVLILAVTLRIFAKEALDLREEKEELEESIEKLTLEKGRITDLFNSFEDMIIALDKKNRLVFLNDAALKTFNIKVGKKLIGKTPPEEMSLYSPGGILSLEEVIEESKKKKTRDDILLITDEETKHYYLTVTKLRGEKDSFEGAIIYLHDITLEKNIENKKSEFAAIASHELRTPLAVIDGYLHLLRTNKKLKYDEETRGYIVAASDASKDVSNLVKDLLETTKIEKGKIPIAISETDFAEIIADVIKEKDAYIKEKKLSIFTNFPEESVIITDKEKLKEIFVNLFDNALKFTDKGSIEISAQKDQKNTLFYLKDTGLGISKDSQRLIFQKFFQAAEWSTRKGGGTGLGLYITKSLVERLGGKIWVESTLGKGSTFYFTIPNKK